MKFISNIFKKIIDKFKTEPIESAPEQPISNVNSKYFEQVNSIVKSLFGHIPPDWTLIISLLTTNPAKLKDEKLFEEYELDDLLDPSNEYLIFDILYDYLLEKKVMLQIDWRGETENFEFANFVVNRFESLTDQNEVASLKQILLDISNVAYDIEYDENTSIVEYLFNHFNQQLANYGLKIIYLDRSWDMNQLVVVNVKEIANLVKVNIQDGYTFAFYDGF